MTHVIGTAGHVDHGKSTLVQAMTGIDPDRLAEEKQREMTIDLGFAWLTLPSGRTVGIVDVPGHRDFIENMLAGVGGIDLALLVIAADEGVMPQTREHLAILDLLGVTNAVVALTKIDMVPDPEWLELVALDVSELLDQTALRDAPIVPVSARTGDGLPDLLTALDAALGKQPPRPDLGRPRLPIDRIFTISGFGTVVTGTLTGGSLHVGDEVVIQPRGLHARIRGLQSHKEAISSAQPGSRVAVNLSGVDRGDIQRGDVVTRPGTLRGTTLIDVQFRYLPDAGRPLQHNAEVKFFSGAAESVAHVRLVGNRELLPGEEGWLQLRLAQPLALDKRDRFILRYPSPAQTIGGGVVLDPHPPHRWRRFKPEVIARFETLAAGTPEDLVLHALQGETALTPADLAARTGLAGSAIEAALAALAGEGQVFELLSGSWMALAAWQRLTGRMQAELAAYHQRNPLRLGMPREALRSRLGLSGKLFQPFVQRAVESGILVDAGTALSLPEHRVTFTPAQQAAIDRLMREFQAQPTTPPATRDAAALVGEDVLAALVEQGRLVQVNEDVLFDADTYAELVRQVEQFIEREGSITVAQARDLFNTSRKYVLALLEHLDSIGVTRRTGDERVLRRATR
ncbi:MAG: selenocysteine-specific translation elongation factor [Aggregatilineales bacterium]|nr:selenocysteine-specific translation elongation factor [Aggregatilineales bacterium]HPV06144.1 selenocysteine-specific translation elongation factor [Aggregatilineales bacterium]HQE17371.1 selenocysteine-specific translation elongation factor [Aggregatilineales bacterium]